MLKTHPTITPYKRILRGVERIDWVVYCGTQNGKTVKYTKSSREEAEAFANDFSKRRDKVGDLASRLTSEQIVDAAYAFQTIVDAGVRNSLSEIVKEWIVSKNSSNASKGIPVGRAFDMFMKTMDSTKEHYSTVKRILASAVKLIGGDCSDVSRLNRNTISNLCSLQKSPASWNAYRSVTLTFLKWCVANSMYQRSLFDECCRVEKKKVPYTPRSVMPVCDVEKIMRWAEAQEDAELLAPRFAIAFFAGIRPDEIYRMKWRDVRMSSNVLRVESPKGKTGVPPRIVTIQPNLKAWLLKYQLDDPLPVSIPESRFERRMADMKADTGVVWQRDVARHTFATAYLLKHKSLAKTSDELGHGANESTTKSHYLGRMEVEDAESFWNIEPSKK